MMSAGRLFRERHDLAVPADAELPRRLDRPGNGLEEQVWSQGEAQFLVTDREAGEEQTILEAKFRSCLKQHRRTTITHTSSLPDPTERFASRYGKEVRVQSVNGVNDGLATAFRPMAVPA